MAHGESILFGEIMERSKAAGTILDALSVAFALKLIGGAHPQHVSGPGTANTKVTKVGFLFCPAKIYYKHIFSRRWRPEVY